MKSQSGPKTKVKHILAGVHAAIWKREAVGVFLYINYMGYVQPHRVAFLRRFGLKTGIPFAYVDLA